MERTAATAPSVGLVGKGDHPTHGGPGAHSLRQLRCKGMRPTQQVWEWPWLRNPKSPVSVKVLGIAPKVPARDRLVPRAIVLRGLHNPGGLLDASLDFIHSPPLPGEGVYPSRLLWVLWPSSTAEVPRGAVPRAAELQEQLNLRSVSQAGRRRVGSTLYHHPPHRSAGRMKGEPCQVSGT